MNKLKKFFSKLDWKLVAFPIVFILLAFASYFLLISLIHPFSHPRFIYFFYFASLLIALILISTIFALFLLSLWTLFAPLNSHHFNKYLRNIKQDASGEVAIILGYPNWFKFKSWHKPNFTKREMKVIIKYLEKKGQCFRIYPHASFEDVEKIMSNANIKEVYFCGHGDSHVFKLSTDKTLYYCDFKDPKYKKEFVHQVHCGTPDGKDKRLIDYVVPKENRDKCFYFPRLITTWTIRKEFKKRIKALDSGSATQKN